MAYDANKNEVFFQRVKNWATGVYNLLEERDRLIDIYMNEANGDAAFVDTSVATTAELIAVADVMNQLEKVVRGGAIPDAARIDLLTPFLIEQ